MNIDLDGLVKINWYPEDTSKSDTVERFYVPVSEMKHLRQVRKTVCVSVHDGTYQFVFENEDQAESAYNKFSNRLSDYE